MPMFRVELSREAQRFYEQADKVVSKKLARCFALLEQDPRAGNNIKPLKGQFGGSFRYRLGNLRVVYNINDREVIVFVITIAKRSDVYD
jgi:mRNA interferase RelE/StbE